MVATTIKNLEEHEKEKILCDIISSLEDAAKYDTERLTSRYQESLRDFMEDSRLLYEKLGENFRTEAEKIYEIQMNMKNILENNEQITKVDYEPGTRLTIITKPMWHEKYPLGKYRIDINLARWGLKIFNIDIDDARTYQHPHISS
jgi:hypothetical protein